jgi:ribosomal protein S18
MKGRKKSFVYMYFHHNIRGVKTHEEILKIYQTNLFKVSKDKITNFKSNFEKNQKEMSQLMKRCKIKKRL